MTDTTTEPIGTSRLRVRPKGFYPFMDGMLHPELLPAEAAFELTAADRNHTRPFVGLTVDGTTEPGLYRLADTGASFTGAVGAARAYLAALAPHQRACAVLGMDSPQWRRWTNAFPAWLPAGVQLGRMTPAARAAALDLVREGLSEAGCALVRAAMRLNGALGELVDDYPETLDEFTYWLTVFGEPGAQAPWGWQLMGHHVDVNCVYVGSQLVLAPVFVGAEPTRVDTGRYAGTEALTPETDLGLRLRRALDADQAADAVLSPSIAATDLPPELAGPYNGRHVGGAGQDNRIAPWEGLPVDRLRADQRELLLDLVRVYLQRMPAPHAERKLADVREHLGRTRFSWRGAHDDTGAFYYRIHSPVLWVEYDNHPGIFLDYDEPERFHVHTIVREPNGNDYGRSLLAQHYARFHA